MGDSVCVCVHTARHTKLLLLALDSSLVNNLFSIYHCFNYKLHRLVHHICLVHTVSSGRNDTISSTMCSMNKQITKKYLDIV